MSLNRRVFFNRLAQVGLGATGLGYLNRCTADAEEALLINLEFLQPQADAVLCTASSFQVEWEISGPTPLLLEWSPDGGTSWQPLVGPLDPTVNSWIWSTPNAAFAQAQLRFLAATDRRVLALSAPFQIAPPQLTLVAPAAGSSYLTGDILPIRWETRCLDALNLEYSLNNGLSWKKIASNVPAATGAYDWTVPLEFSQLAKVRISSSTDPTLQVVNTGYLQLIPQLKVKVDDYPSLGKDGGVASLEMAQLGAIAIVRHGPNDYQVLVLTCTHQGCGLQTFDEGETWYCGCHGATFSKRGCVVTSPAIVALDQYTAKFDPPTRQLSITNQVILNNKC